MNNEQLKYAVDVMSAALNGAAIEFKTKSRDLWIDATGKHTLNWNWEECDYRVKPTKTFRPWKSEEVPVGAQTRVPKFPSERTMIVGVTSTGVMLAQDNGSYPFGDLMKFREYSTDDGKTWKPCGVEVEQ